MSRPDADVSRSRKVVMVIDDDETVLLLAEQFLNSAGFEVLTFTGAEEALEACSKSLPDIAVVDLVLPGMNGFKFCSKLRHLPGGKQVPLLIMTFLDDPVSIDMAYEAGATDFAAKPINWDIETHRLRYLLRGAETTRKLGQKEQEARTAKEEWEKTFNSIQDMVTVMDRDLRILRCNAAVAEVLGKPIASIVGKHCYRLFQEADAPCPDCPVVYTRETGLAGGGEIEYRRPGGVWHVSCSPLPDEAGRETRVVYVARDLRKQKQLEANLRHAQKMEAIGTLAGGIAHEFNNLLQVILGNAEMLGLQMTQSGGASQQCKMIIEAAERARELTLKLLDFSRKESGSSTKAAIDLNCVVRDVQAFLERILPKQVSLSLRLSPELRAINADEDQMHQVLINLVLNGSQAMPEGGLLTIETRNVILDDEFCELYPEAHPGPYVLLAISDTGRGMNESTMERIYEPFFTTRGVGEGTGLGLSVVFGIVKVHGGTIVCNSRPGVGTVFHTYFPVCDQADGHPQDETEAQRAGRAASRSIMLVDDEPMIRKLVEHFLVKQGFAVIMAADGESALRRYQEEPLRPGMVILDLGMPGMSGWECLSRLRSIDPEARVLVATGYGEEEESRAVAMGACGLIYKPYNLSQLASRIDQILSK